MQLTDVLTQEQIYIGLEADTKQAVIEQLATALDEKGVLQDKNLFIQSVLEREAHSTTGVGSGVAIPHGKSSAVKTPTIAYAKLKKPVEWQALDDKPVEIVILLAIPEDAKGDTHLKLLSQIAVKLMDDDLLAQLKKEEDKQTIIKLLQDEGE